MTRQQQIDECTGLAATWCPVHGDCTCEARFDHPPGLDAEHCPLHSWNSKHAEARDD